MKKIVTILILMMSGVVLMMGQDKEPSKPSSEKQLTILPNYVQGTSREMQALDNEVRGWKNKAQSVENFKRVEKRILQQIEKNPADRAEGYLRLGQMHRLQFCPEACSDSLAILYYKKAEKELTRPCDTMFKQATLAFLARSYMLPGKHQNLYMSQQYFLRNMKYSTRQSAEIAYVYLFGWGVAPDLFLAAHFFMQGTLSVGENQNSILLYYIDYLINHKEELKEKHNNYAPLEDFAYIYCIENSIYRCIYPLSLSAELGNAAAQDLLGYRYSYDMAGMSDRSNKLEGFRLLRNSANKGFDESLYLLGNHCMVHSMDVDKGDIYTTDDEGNYRLEDQKAIANGALRLMQKAALQGNVKAILSLADIYTNTYHDPAIETDYSKAFYYVKAAKALGARMTSRDIEKELRKEMKANNVTISEEDSIFLTHNAQNLALEILFNHSSLLDRIIAEGDIKHPQGGDRSRIKVDVPEEIMKEVHKKNPQVTDADYMKAEAYAMVYNTYLEKLKQLSNENPTYSNQFRRFLQQMMVRVRERSEKLPYNLIEASELEK